NFGVSQTGRCLDPDLLFLTSTLVFCGYVQDTVGVDVERYLDLRDATRCRRNAIEVEASNRAVVLRHRPFTLQDVDLHARLIGGSCREYFRLLRRNGCVRLDKFREHTSQCLDTE